MGWDKDRYYTHSKKVNGRVVREYYGCGELALQFADIHAFLRQIRENERAIRRKVRAEEDTLDDQVNEINDLADLVARAALIAAGYHQHKRGEWRRKRGKFNDGGRKNSDEA